MMQGLAGWQILTGEPGRPADEERHLARRPLRRLRVDDRAARRALAGAARRRRLRLRRLAVRDGAARADVHRPVGGDARLRAAAAAELRARRRSSPSRTSAPPTAGSSSAAAKQSFWERLCEVIGEPGLGRRIRASRPWRRGTRTATSSCRSSRSVFASRTVREWLDAARDGGSPSGEGEHGARGARRAADRGPRRRRRARASDARHGADDPHARSGSRPAASARTPPARGPFRGEHTDEVLAELCGYTPRADRASCARQASSAKRRCPRERARLRRLRRDSRPTRSGRAARGSRSTSSSTTRRAARTRRSRATRRRRRSCTRWSARRRRSADGT